MSTLIHPAIKDVTLEHVLNALGDESRMRIVRNIFDADRPLNCQDAAKGIEDLPVSTRSHCFRVLREGGIIFAEKKGRDCFSTIRTEELNTKFPNLLTTILSAK
jgi:predicted transcriptional regulator